MSEDDEDRCRRIWPLSAEGERWELAGAAIGDLDGPADGVRELEAGTEIGVRPRDEAEEDDAIGEVEDAEVTGEMMMRFLGTGKAAE